MTGKLVKVKRDAPFRGYTQRRTRVIPIGEGLPTLDDMRDEIAEYMDVLLGRTDAPVQGPSALMETADIYYARASELIMKIQQGETDGVVPKGSALTRFRTGELRTFQEIASKAAALGSRRITALQLTQDREKTGRESA
jgi:hypothetical protein